MDKFKIKYLGHSAFLVETEKCYLMFDYTGTNSEYGYTTKQAVIDFDDYKDKRLYMFQSHNHFDHYNRKIHNKALDYENIVTILGDIESDAKRTINIVPDDINDINDEIRVYAGRSTDLGVCFLVDLGDLVIFHSGDNADWGGYEQENAIYYEEIDFLSSIDLKINIAFVPICNFMGKRSDNMTKGALYMVEKMNPDYIIPMHGGGYEHNYEEFAKDVKEKGITNKVIIMKKIGDEV